MLQYSPAGLVLNGEYINLLLLHPIMLQASTANSYLVYGAMFVVILIIVAVVVYWPVPGSWESVLSLSTARW